MKRFFYLLMIAITLVSCESNEDNDNEYLIIDLTPIEFRFDIINESGESLIDKNSPAYDTAFIANTYIEFQGKVYKMGEDAKTDVEPSSRYFYDTFHGIRTNEYPIKQGSYEIKTLAEIGPFLSDYDWESEEIKIHWGDNSEDNIIFSSAITSKNEKGFPVFTRKYLFNGNESTDTFQIPYSYMQLVKNSIKED